MVQHPKSATTIYLDQPPSCLEFCPEIPNYFVVGTYLLSETKDEAGEIQQAKTGSVQLWKLDPGTSELSLVQRIALPSAVFDLHFHPRHRSKFAIASSTGCVTLFNISRGTTQPSIEQVWTKQVHEDRCIPALFLAWAPQHWFPNPKTDGFAVTFSDSRTVVFGTEGDLNEEHHLTELGVFNARQMIEVWLVALAAFSKSQSDNQEKDLIPYMFTGDDFGSLHTRRFEKHSLDEAGYVDSLLPTVLDYDDRARHHTAGVTSILPLPIPLVNNAPILLTGSYDECLRVYHASRRGEVLAEQGLGGGVWRLQLLNSVEATASESSERHFWILASCMHAGTRLVRVTQTQSGWEIEVLAEFTEHESMNYASDVWKGAGLFMSSEMEETELLFVTSSFYDRRVCVWRASASAT